MIKGTKTKKGTDISTRNLSYILRNPVYKGCTRWTPDKRIYWDFSNESTLIVLGKHEPIISEETFDAVQLKLDTQEKTTKAKARPTETTKHWLSGLIRCAHCGHVLCYNGIMPTRKKAAFRCGGYGKGVCKHMNFLLIEEAESTLMTYLTSTIQDINVLYDASVRRVDTGIDEINYLNAELSRAKKKLNRATKAYLDGAFEVDQYKEIKTDTENEMKLCREKLAEYSKPKTDYLALQKDAENVCEVLKNDKFSKDEKQKAVRSIIEKIVFNKRSGDFRIYFYR